VKINPVGFLFESYDTIGRYRTVDDNGQPVNTAVTIVGSGNAAVDVATANATEFADRLGVNDTDVANCMMSQLYRFVSRRKISNPDRDEVAKLSTAFSTSNQSFKQVLLALTQSEVFLNRLNVK
jgi:hypothetical protein